MNRAAIALLLLSIVVFSTFTVSGQAPIEKQQTFLSVLKEGQPVSIKEVSGRYDITTLEGVPGVQGHKVLTIGSDYLVVQDISGIHEIHIPMWSIKAIIRVKLPQK